MLVQWRSLHGRHKDTAMCRSGADKKRRRDTEAEIRESAERVFEAYGGQLESVSRFTYLGRVKGYGVGDRVSRLLATYWERTTMVARAGQYYGTGFKGERGVTQGDPLSPTIFNVVVDTVVRHWLLLDTQ